MIDYRRCQESAASGIHWLFIMLTDDELFQWGIEEKDREMKNDGEWAQRLEIGEVLGKKCKPQILPIQFKF